MLKGYRGNAYTYARRVMASIKFEKFKKLTRADVTVSEDLDSMTINVYGKNPDEPVASATLDDFRSPEFMHTASDA